MTACRRRRGLGLMWLTLANENAGKAKKDKWITDLYAKATVAASDTDKQIAALYVADFRKALMANRGSAGR